MYVYSICIYTIITICDHSCRGSITLCSHREKIICPRSFARSCHGPVHRDDGRGWLRTHRQPTVLKEAGMACNRWLCQKSY